MDFKQRAWTREVNLLDHGYSEVLSYLELYFDLACPPRLGCVQRGLLLLSSHRLTHTRHSVSGQWSPSELHSQVGIGTWIFIHGNLT